MNVRCPLVNASERVQGKTSAPLYSIHAFDGYSFISSLELPSTFWEWIGGRSKSTLERLWTLF